MLTDMIAVAVGSASAQPLPAPQAQPRPREAPIMSPTAPLSVVPPPVAPPPVVRPAPTAPPPMTPPVRRGGTISDVDYPAAALDSRQEGVSLIQLAVGENGRVTACSVTNTSGSASLDSTACSLARRRFRFTPATRAGEAVASSYPMAIRWQLPVEDMTMIAVAPGSLTWTVTASAAGVTACTAVADGQAFADYDWDKCSPSDQPALVDPKAIGAAARTVEVVQILELSPGDGVFSAPKRRDPVWEAAASLMVDERGKVTGCTPGPGRGTLPAFVRPDLGSLCNLMSGGRWFVGGAPGVQAVRIRSLVYVRPAGAPKHSAS